VFDIGTNATAVFAPRAYYSHGRRRNTTPIILGKNEKRIRDGKRNGFWPGNLLTAGPIRRPPVVNLSSGRRSLLPDDGRSRHTRKFSINITRYPEVRHAIGRRKRLFTYISVTRTLRKAAFVIALFIGGIFRANELNVRPRRVRLVPRLKSSPNRRVTLPSGGVAVPYRRADHTHIYIRTHVFTKTNQRTGRRRAICKPVRTVRVNVTTLTPPFGNTTVRPTRLKPKNVAQGRGRRNAVSQRKLRVTEIRSAIHVGRFIRNVAADKLFSNAAFLRTVYKYRILTLPYN